MKPAPSPSDILFEHIGYDLAKTKFVRYFTLFVSLVEIFVSFLVILSLSFYQHRLKKKSSTGGNVQVMVESLLCSISIAFINFVLGLTLTKLTAAGKYQTFTNFKSALVARLTIYFTINTSIIVFLINVTLSKSKQWTSDNLNTNLAFIMLFNTLFTPVYAIFSPFAFIKWFKRWRIRQQGGKCQMTQIEANAVFEDDTVDIANMYAQIVKMMYLAGFYSTLFPLGIPIAILGLFIQYWAFKYLLLRRNSIKVQYGGKLNMVITDLLEFFPLSFSLGHFVVGALFKEKMSYLDYISLAFVIMCALLPMGLLNEKVFKIDSQETKLRLSLIHI
eukprot:TRINITY_DN4730_c0_g1_i2.p1 TRINITY_DN4730_c0_g1~~TRINITY_DN4730_c0_g1_i2.p1  ORF type:complete len:332 (+),score=6.59 TRINITY_DN4730_c0_g1_i2:2-997(+)